MRAIFLLLAVLTTVADASDIDYGPLGVHMRWDADATLTAADGRVIKGSASHEVTGTKVINAATYFVVESHIIGIPGFGPFTKYVRKAPEGAFSINAADPEMPEQLELPYPIEVGRTWRQKNANGEAIFKVEAVEPVTIGDTVYDGCLKVSYTFGSPPVSAVYYLAPRIGIVLETMKFSGNTLEFRLRSFKKPD